MIEIIPFNRSFEHVEYVIYMHETQSYPDMHLIIEPSLPQVGVIAMSDGILPVAAGFLRMVEGGYAQLDTLVSNADCSSIMRNEGISDVVDALLIKANQLKLKGIYSFTRDKSVLIRAEDIGFKRSDQTLITLAI